MSEVHAPYHFVPLSKWVHMPDWADQVSHDVPFSDGLSGSIELKLQTHSPLCVGGNQTQVEGQPTKVHFQKDPAGEPVIPGSSIKGLLRSVLEVAGFGKFKALDDQRLSHRNIANSGTDYANEISNSRIQAGWVKFDNQAKSWIFTPCRFVKIKHKAINDHFKTRIKNESSAVDKYKQLDLTKQCTATMSEPTGKQNNRWAESLGKGDKNGHIVFTNTRIKGKGKPEDYEFSYFFYDNDAEAPVRDISSLVEQLFTNHDEKQVDHLKNNPHPDLGIPVFALFDKQSNTLKHLGFAKMPRIAYKNSFVDLIKNNAHTHETVFDLAELIFGTLRDQELSLKGRVGFTDLKPSLPAKSKLYWSSPLILNGPKPSFYPAYLEQRGGKLQTYNDDGAQLAGWKRYIAKQPEQAVLASPADNSLKVNVASQLELVPQQTQFEGRLVFHNLRPVELGALLWCIQLGVEANTQHVHGLGHGKPFGAGLVSFTPVLNLRDGEHSINELTNAFVDYMNQAYPDNPENAWIDSPQIKYLMLLTDYQANADVDTAYMSLDGKEFQQAQSKDQSLPPLHGQARKEPLLKTEPSVAFGRGRLAKLVDAAKDDRWVQSQQQVAQQLQEQAALARLPECQQTLQKLTEELEPMAPENRAEPMRNAVQQFIEHSTEYQKESAEALRKLLRAYEFHKKPKKRKDEHKDLLEQLAQAYQLQPL